MKYEGGKTFSKDKKKRNKNAHLDEYAHFWMNK
jgi:hypothetical protein